MLGIVLHAMVPTGFMPAAENGKITLVICSGMGEKTIVVDAKDHLQSSDQSSDEHQSVSACPYFLAQFMGFYPEQPALAVPVFVSASLWNLQHDQDAFTNFFVLPPPRGPPSSLV